jgi:hypothetical protein
MDPPAAVVPAGAAAVEDGETMVVNPVVVVDSTLELAGFDVVLGREVDVDVTLLDVVVIVVEVVEGFVELEGLVEVEEEEEEEEDLIVVVEDEETLELAPIAPDTS